MTKMEHLPPEVDNVGYELFILKRMLEQLPGKSGQLLQEQFSKVVSALQCRDQFLRSQISDTIDDTILQIKLQEFDLEVTRKERDELRDNSA